MGYAIAGEPDFADDGIHIEAWNFVTKLVSAAHESDMAHFGEILRRFEEMTELTEQANTPFIYLMYALHDHISRICRRGVYREELLSISSDMYPLVNQRLEIKKRRWMISSSEFSINPITCRKMPESFSLLKVQ